MKIKVLDMNSREIDIDALNPSQTVRKLKLAIQNFTGVLPEEQSLMFRGVTLDDESLLSDYGIVEDCVVNMVQSTLGGYWLQ